MRSEVWNTNVLIVFGFILGSLLGSVFLLTLHDFALKGPDRIQWETLVAASVALLGAGTAFAGGWVPYRKNQIEQQRQYYYDCTTRAKSAKVDCEMISEFGFRHAHDLETFIRSLEDVLNWPPPPSGTLSAVMENQSLVKLEAWKAKSMILTEETNRKTLADRLEDAPKVEDWKYEASMSEISSLAEALENLSASLEQP